MTGADKPVRTESDDRRVERNTQSDEADRPVQNNEGHQGGQYGGSQRSLDDKPRKLPGG